MTANPSPRLSQIAGNYREWAPVAPLREHVSCLWVNDLRTSSVSLLQVVPDGCVDILWNGQDLIVAGPDTEPVLSNLAPRSAVVGVRFRPGAALSWLGVPLNEIVNARLPLGEFWKLRTTPLAATVASLEAQLSQAPDLPEAARILERALLARLPQAGPMDARIAFLRKAASEDRPTRSGAGYLDVRSLATRLGMSERTLHRRSLDVFGYGLKTLHRIARFQRFFALARHSPNQSLVTLAAEAGFADQAHLTREVQRLGGKTPSRFVAQLNDE